MNVDTQTVWHEFYNRLRSFVSRRVRGADADDVLQDIFVRVHKNLPSVEDKTRLPAWLFTVARSAIADYYRKHRPTEPLAEDFDLANDESSAQADVELSQCLEPMIEALPKSYRDAIRAIELAGMRQSQAAMESGVSVSGMKTRVQRGRQKLKDMLLRCCEIELDKRGGVISYEPRGPCSSCGPCQ